MASVQIPNLGAVVGLDGTELLEVVQGGTSKRVTSQQLATFISGGGALLWGSITGTLSNQVDLQAALTAATNAAAWGSITGSLTDQVDLTAALNSKASVLANNVWLGTNTFGDGTGAPTVTINGAAAGNRTLAWQTNGALRWTLQANSAAESGANAGSNFDVSSYTDAGALIETPLSINRATGVATLKSLTLTNALGLASGGVGSTNASIGLANLQGGGRTSIPSAAGTTTLTNTSSSRYLVTGSSSQTFVLPVVSTLSLGVTYEIAVGTSVTGVTVQSSGLNLITTLSAGYIARFTCILITGTTGASWDWDYIGSYAGATGTGSLVYGTGPAISRPIGSASTLITAGTNAQGQGNITSDYNIVTTTASNPSGVTLPVPASAGRTIRIVNKGTNPVSLYPSSGGTIDALVANNPVTIPVNGTMRLWSASTTQWYSDVNQAASATSLTGIVPVANGGTSASNAITAALNLRGGAVQKVASGNVTLTNTSPQNLWCSQVTAQTVTLPDVTTIPLGSQYWIYAANASGAGTAVQSSGAGAIVTIPAGLYFVLQSTSITDNTAAGWEFFVGGSWQGSTGSGQAVFRVSPTLTNYGLVSSPAVTAGTNAQGQGALTNNINFVTTAANNPSGVTLPSPFAAASTSRLVIVVNKGANPLACYPASGHTIDALAANAAITIPVNGIMYFWSISSTQWYSSVNLITVGNGTQQIITSGSGNFTVPSYGTFCLVRVWGAGGAGGRGGATAVDAGGGGGGGYAERLYKLSAIGAPGTTVAYSVGAGGAGVAVAGTGNAGGNTTFGTGGTLITGFGGGAGGGNAASAGGGGGGGQLSAGGNASGATAGTAGIGGASGNFTSTSPWGGGGGSTSNFQGGWSFLGGGGGGGSTGALNGGSGTTLLGGIGGAGAFTGGVGGAGTAPGGGGGGYGANSGTSGAGAAGQIEIYVW